MHLLLVLLLLIYTNFETQRATLLFKREQTLFLKLEESLLIQPKQAVSEACSRPSHPQPKTFACQTQLLWHTREGWKKPCSTPKSKRRYPPRYYRISITCHMGGIRLGAVTHTSHYR